MVVDGRLLLDGGAPLLPHMHRLGIDPGGIDAVFLTHFHGDHVLGLPPFMLHRAFIDPRPLTVVGPAGVEERLERLFELSWGQQWAEVFRPAIGLTYQEAGASGEAAGVPYETVLLDHGRHGCTGFRLRVGDRLLAYAGDTEATAPLDDLVRGADVAITEATGPGPQVTHTGFEDAEALASRHPSTRFFFNHCYAGGVAHTAADLDVVEV